MDIAVHFILPVSFFMVKIVVAQGQCKSEKSITEMAVAAVQPFEISISFIAVSPESSVRAPSPIYPIIAIGITISLAGEPNIKLKKIMPSSPKSWANGSRKFAQ